MITAHSLLDRPLALELLTMQSLIACYPQQEVCTLAQYIATMYSGSSRNRMVAAASDCRVPYFDWAATPSNGGSMLPASIGGSPKINVTGPAGTQQISNPLFNYDFKPPDPSVFYGANPVSSRQNLSSRSSKMPNKTTVGSLEQHDESTD